MTGLLIVAATLATVWIVRVVVEWFMTPLPVAGSCWVCGEWTTGRARVLENDETIAELYACCEHMGAVRDFMLAEHFGIHHYELGDDDDA